MQKALTLKVSAKSQRPYELVFVYSSEFSNIQKEDSNGWQKQELGG